MNVKYVNIENSDPLLSVNCLISDNINDLTAYPHIHNEIEIIYIIRGNITLILEGASHILSENSITVINRLCTHEFSDNNFTRFLLLQFKPTSIYESNKMIDIKYLKPFFHTKKFRGFTSAVTSVELENMRDTLFDIEQKIREKDIAYDIAVQSDLIRILYLMYTAKVFDSKIIESIKQKRDLQQLATLLEYVESHYDEPITLNQASTIAKLDYHYFSRIFKEQTGKTFIEYLNFIRILNAQRMLCETDFSIATIATSVGIPNISYFNRIFKNQNGITPIQYRNRKGILSK